jgi:CRISPR-associated protein Csd1
MILQALFNYYDRMKNDLPPEGFEQKEIPFLIIINHDGEFINLQDTRTQFGKKLIARKFRVPKENALSGKNAWQATNLLWDHYGYVLEHPKSNTDKDKEMAEKQHKTFIDKVQTLVESFPEDLELQAVKRFYTDEHYKKVFNHPSWEDCKKINGCNLSFQISGESRLICQNENVNAYISRTIETESDDVDDDSDPHEIEGICMITGEYASIARLHPRTPIPGAKSNAKIVSFQKNMGFDSYDKQQSYNAPVSKRAVFAYTTALNYMLAKDSRQKIYVGDATTVFWAEKKHEFENVLADIFGEPPKDNPDQDYKELIAMFRSPETGAKPELNPNTRFFVLGLSPNSARIAVRFWYADSVREIAENLYQHFDDIEIVRPLSQPKHLSLFRLLVSTAVQGKSENIQPNLAGDIMKAILAGIPYPETLLFSLIRRIKAEREVTYPRASLIKAVLVRKTRYKNEKEEVGMSLDTNNANAGYRMGRLFAVLEKIQEEANPGINATIRDRFYGSASSVPVTVFPHLMKLKNYHIAKLENRGRAVNFEKQIGEIINDIKDFPSHLSLDDQGRFAVGYYHQRQDFFRKKETNE